MYTFPPQTFLLPNCFFSIKQFFEFQLLFKDIFFVYIYKTQIWFLSTIHFFILDLVCVFVFRKSLAFNLAKFRVDTENAGKLDKGILNFLTWKSKKVRNQTDWSLAWPIQRRLHLLMIIRRNTNWKTEEVQRFIGHEPSTLSCFHCIS